MYVSMIDRNRFLMLFLMGQLGGWYTLYWMCSVQNETNKQLFLLGKNKKGMDNLSGGLVGLYSILSLGIFAIVWQFYMCAKIKKLGGRNIYAPIIIMSILFIGIIANPLIIQGELNKLANNNISNNLNFS